MDWIQVFTIIGTLGAFMIYMLQRIEKDIDKLSSRLDSQGNRLDGHAQRIDQLYQVILTILKEKK